MQVSTALSSFVLLRPEDLLVASVTRYVMKERA
jgi:hypothetical protein